MTKILLVDDSKFLRLATERALSRAGYDVSSATDGEQALTMAREGHPDLILLDMLLPKIPGPEVLKALKKDPETADIPVVVFTGLSQKNAARLQNDGAFGYLEKTGLGLDKDCEALVSAVENIVRQLPERKLHARANPEKIIQKRKLAGEKTEKSPKNSVEAQQASRA